MSVRITRELICNSCGVVETDEQWQQRWVSLEATASGGRRGVIGRDSWQKDLCPQCWESVRTSCSTYPTERDDSLEHGTRGAYEFWNCRCVECQIWYRMNHSDEIDPDMYSDDGKEI